MRSLVLLAVLGTVGVAEGGCSLLFREAGNPAGDGGSSATGDGGIGVDVDADVGEPTLFGDIEMTIGDEGDFVSFENWKKNRSGDLTRRQQMRVRGTLVAAGTGQVLTAGPGRCQGTLRAQSDAAAVTDLLTLDLSLDSSPCEIGDNLSNGEVAEGVLTVVEAGPGGSHEAVTVLASASPLAAPVVIEDFTTDTEHHLEFLADPQAPHLGRPGQGVIIRGGAPSASAHGIDVRVDYTEITGFEITEWAAGAGDPGDSTEGIHVDADFVTIDRVLVHSDGNTVQDANNDGIRSDVKGVTLTVRNSFIYDISRAGILLQGIEENGALLNVDNCSLAACSQRDAQTSIVYGCVGFAGVKNGVMNVRNTVALAGSGGDDASPAFHIDAFSAGSEYSDGSTRNASNDGSATGTSVITLDSDSPTFVSLQEGAIDLHLSNDDTQLTSTGENLGFYSLDIDGQERSDVWSVGADEPSAP